MLPLLAACESPPKKACVPCEALPAPIVTVDAPLDEPPPIERSASVANAEKCPVGDHSHSDIYWFLELAFEEAKDEGPKVTREVIANDIEHVKKGEKPRSASTVESSTSHALQTLCAGAPGCRSIGLYTKSGLAFALSWSEGDTLPIGFDEPTWRRLQVKAGGATVALDGKTYVVFYAENGGRAICMIDA